MSSHTHILRNPNTNHTPTNIPIHTNNTCCTLWMKKYGDVGTHAPAKEACGAGEWEDGAVGGGEFKVGVEG
jgi:hypothetical protein